MKKNKNLKLLILAFFLTFPVKVSAKEINNKSLQKEPSYMVEFNVLGSNLSLTKNDNFYIPAMEDKINFLNSKFNFLNKSLKDVANISSALQVSGGPRGNAQSFSMRGFDKNGIAFLVDDIPISFLSQHSNFIPVDLLNISSANIIRGPFSSIYGSNALGGVVSFSTISASDLLFSNKRMGYFINTGFSSANNRFIVAGGSYGRTDNSDFLGSISFFNSTDIKTGNNNQINIPERNREISGMLKQKYFLQNKGWLSASYYFNLNKTKAPANSEQNNNSSMLKNINHDINVESHLIRLSHNIDGNKGANPNMLTMLYINYFKQEETPEEDFPGGSFYKKDQKLGKINYIFGAKHLEDITLNFNNDINHFIVYGADYKYQKQNKNNTDPRGLIANAYSNNLGLFFQDDLSLTKVFNITGAMRYDYFYLNQSGGINNTKPYNQLSPKISFAYKPYSPFMTYISYGRAFRTPNLNEIYASGLHYSIPGPHGGSNYLIPNTSLKPSTADTLEGGYGFKFNNLSLDGEIELKNAVYYTFVKNYITLNMDMRKGTSQYVNVDKVRMTGIDLSVNYKNKYFKTNISYNYIKAIDKNTNANLLNISANTFKLNYEQNIINTGFFVGYNFRVQSSFNICKTEPGMGSYICSYGTDKRPGFVTHDIYTGFTKNNKKISFIISNLTDKFYYDTFAGLPSAGRSYKVFFTIRM